MRKLRKNHTSFENSVEAYVCICSCSCTCPVGNNSQFNANGASHHNNLAQGLAGNQSWMPMPW